MGCVGRWKLKRSSKRGFLLSRSRPFRVCQCNLRRNPALIPSFLGGIKVDISVYNTNGVKAGEVVKEYLDALPAARPLVLLVKAYMWKIHKNEVFTGGMGSYSTICLAISFLQVRSVDCGSCLLRKLTERLLLISNIPRSATMRSTR